MFVGSQELGLTTTALALSSTRLDESEVFAESWLWLESKLLRALGWTPTSAFLHAVFFSGLAFFTISGDAGRFRVGGRFLVS